MGLFEMLMGKLGLSILAWLQEHMEISLGVLAVYFLIMYSAKYQVRKIQTKTIELIKDTIRELKTRKRSLSVSTVLKKIQPIWIEKSKKWAIFVPGKYSLYPISHKPKKTFNEFVTREVIQSILKNERTQ